MKDAWKIVPLEKVLRYRKEFIHISDLEKYKRCRVQCHVQGIVLRDLVEGTQIRTKNQQICKEGDFLVAEIDAKLGGFGIVPEELEGAIVSSHYYLYEIDEDLLDRSFFSFFIRTPYFRDQVSSQGSTNYAAIRYYDVLGYTMPLPPIAGQRRIVARIEELAAKIEEARGLREGAIKESDALEKALLDEVYKSNLENFGSVKLSEVCLTITDGDHFTPSFQGTGVKFIFVGNVSSGSLHFQGCKYVSPEYYAAIKSHRKPENGDILYSAVGATLGIPAIVDSDEEFCFQRHVALLKPDRSQLIPKFLWHILRSRSLYRAAWERTTGSAQPTVPLRSIRSLQVPKPPLDEQKSIVLQLDDLQSKADAIKQLREDSLKEFDALLPAILDKAFKGEL